MRAPLPCWLSLVALSGCEGTLAPPGDTVAIPAGSFLMGCDRTLQPECAPDETPVHEVALDAFAIDRTEVTQAAYAACVADGNCARPRYPECHFEPGTRGDFPVVCVSWSDAKAYCGWAGKRLCSEAEWERAARGSDVRLYPWGDEAPTCEHAVYADCAAEPQPVGSHSPTGDSADGVADLAGNVWEWVADRYAADAYARADCCDNPRGPGAEAGSYRVSRGSAFFSPSSFLRLTVRYWDFPSYVGDYLGVRCCADR